MSKRDLAISDISASLPALWERLDREQQRYIADHYTVHRYRKNEIIYRENDAPRDLLCLISGKVKIFKEGVGGRNQIIRVVKKNEYFGYRAYFAEEKFVTTASALEPCVICHIPMPIIMTIVSDNPRLSFFFIRCLSVDLGIADRRTVNLTQKHIRGRLAESLLFLKDTYGVEEDESTLSIYLSREDLASLSNMTTANAIRTLSNFAAEKIIAIDGRKIKLIDEEHLRRISSIG